MLVNHIALLIVKILGVHPWQTVQDLLNRNASVNTSNRPSMITSKPANEAEPRT
jgi:hypothetical protein